MIVAHLAASPFLGGPESQLLGMVRHLPAGDRAAVLSFGEGGRCRALLDAARALGAEAVELRHNAPHYRAAVAEVASHLRDLHADVLIGHGYKPDILGLFAARRAGLPVLMVAHGWTAATWKVRLNETLDRWAMRRADRVVCVSEAQAGRVRRAGVAADRAVVVRNAIEPGPSVDADPAERRRLESLFATPPRLIVGAVGRLSPEKGFGVLVEAAAKVARRRPDVGFVHHGDGPIRSALAARIEELGLAGRFVLAGFRPDVSRAYPAFDVLALPSYTEGLPCVILEAFAAGVPVVATAVGGTPEVVSDGPDGNGRLVAPGDPDALAGAILDLAADTEIRHRLGRRGRALVLDRFTFAAQARAYQSLFADLGLMARVADVSPGNGVAAVGGALTGSSP